MGSKEIHNLLITGISSDVGIEFVESYSDEYNLIMGQYVHMNDGLNRLKDELGDRLILVEADLSNEAGIKTIIDKIAATETIFDSFIHLASPKAENIQFRKESWNNLEEKLTVSVKSVYEILQAILPDMVKAKYGRVVMMLTAYTKGVPPKFQTSYVTSKYALLGLMKSLAVEYRPYGICINGISPDMMDTKFIEDLPHPVVEQSIKNSTFGRNLTPKDIVPEIKHLLSEDAKMISGHNLEIYN